MRVAMVFAGVRSACDEPVVAPFHAPDFLAGLIQNSVDPLLVTVVPDGESAQSDSPAARSGGGGDTAAHLRCRPSELRALVSGMRPDVIQTFGSLAGLAAIWPMLARADVPIGHCVSGWGEYPAAPPYDPARSRHRLTSLAAFRARRASRHVAGVIGTSRAGVADLIASGYFPSAWFSTIIRVPVASVAVPAGTAPAGTAAGKPTTRLGVYAPRSSRDALAFVSRAMALTGSNDLRILMAVGASSLQETAPAGISLTAASPLWEFLAAIEVLALPVYDDSDAGPVVAALRAGKSVIVPDRGGGAELIEFGRRGLMFPAGSAYHFASALNIVSQSLDQKGLLIPDSEPVVARTDPAAVARMFADFFVRLAAQQPGQAPRTAHG